MCFAQIVLDQIGLPAEPVPNKRANPLPINVMTRKTSIILQMISLSCGFCCMDAI